MQTILAIITVIYLFSVVFAKEALKAIYSEEGIWSNRLEYVVITNFRTWTPIVNTICIFILLKIGIYKK
jgi:hypothetical protein